jgi:hypothetical protein
VVDTYADYASDQSRKLIKKESVPFVSSVVGQRKIILEAAREFRFIKKLKRVIQAKAGLLSP